MKEIEAKFKINKIDEWLKHKDFTVCSKIKILDIYFSHPQLNFKTDDRVLRLRKENDQYFIAYKGPREKHHNLIIREELEFLLTKNKIATKFIKALGFIEKAKAEKIRINLKNKYFPKLKITLDQYPFIKNFIEIEGEEKEVLKFIKKYNLKNSLQKNCTEIFLEYYKNNKLKFKNPELHFTFNDEKTRG